MKKANKKQKTVQKYDLHAADDIWSSLASEDAPERDDDLFLDDLLYDNSYADDPGGNEQTFDAYDDNYSDDAFEDEQVFETGDEQYEVDDSPNAENLSDAVGFDEEQVLEESAEESSGIDEFSAMLEYVGGMRQEAARARLFEPHENTILLVDEQTNDEQVVFLEQLACLQLSGLPQGMSGKQKESGTKEIIETVDGKTYHALVCAKQPSGGLLFCFTAEDQASFPVILFPKSNIRKRCQDKLLVDILVEKRFISKSILQKALQEFEQIKGMTLEKIIAQKARIPLADIEQALNSAKQNQMLGLQTGEILLLSGLADEELILEALEYHENIENLTIEQFLIDKGFVNEMEVYASLAEKHRIPFVDLRQKKIPKESLAILPESMILNHEILPLVKKDDILLVATHLADIAHLSESILGASGCKQVKYVIAPPSHIRKIISMR